MTKLVTRLMNDEAGFVVSSELVLVATIGVLAMLVGLSEVAININNELEDVGSSVGSINQSYNLSGSHGHMAMNGGSGFRDNEDYCDNTCDIQPGSNIDGE